MKVYVWVSYGHSCAETICELSEAEARIAEFRASKEMIEFKGKTEDGLIDNFVVCCGAIYAIGIIGIKE